MYALTQKYLESTLNLSTASWAGLILLFQPVTAISTSSHVFMAEIGKWHHFFVDRPHTEYFGPPFLSRVKIPNQISQIGQALPHSCRYLLYILYS